MKLKPPKNPNYAAIIVEVSNIIPLEGMDRAQAAIVLGNQVIVDKSVKKGDIGVYFPVECKLSSNYLAANNLYRKKELNADKDKGGYFEENGRVRCVKFVGKHKSEGIFMPLESITNMLINTDLYDLKLNVGDTFDEVEGIEICRKYTVNLRQNGSGLGGERSSRGKVEMETKLIDNQFRFHDDTSMLFRNLHKLNPDSIISITYKLHGTSGISSKVLCKKPLAWYEKTLKMLGVNVVDTHYDYLYSSRNVIKNPELLKDKSFQDHYTHLRMASKKRYVEKYYLETFNTAISNELYRDIFPLDTIGTSIFTIDYFESKLPGFKEYLEKLLCGKSKGHYGEDIWGLAHNKVKDFLHNGMTLYYEIVGFLPYSGGSIQKSYDYGCEDKQFAVYIYRITHTNVDGKVVEYSAKQVQEWCKKNGLTAVPELFYGKASELLSDNRLNSKSWQNKFLQIIKDRYNEKDCFMCNNKVPEEGCVIRIEGLEFEAYKQKSTAFYELETKQLDKGESNIEDDN